MASTFHRGTRPAVFVAAIALFTLTAVPAWAVNGVLGADDSGPNSSALVSNCPGYRYDSYFGQLGYSTSSGLTYYNAPASSGLNNSTDIQSAYNNYVAGHGIGVGGLYWVTSVSGTSYPQTQQGAY